MFFSKKSQIFGAFERVVFPEFNDAKILAKVDTGAWNGAVHATHICDTGDRLTFELLGKKQLTFTTKNFRETTVASANGHKEERYIIPVKLKIGGIVYNAEIGLDEREKLSQKMLLGRRFLLENHILVDVSRNHEFSFEQPQVISRLSAKRLVGEEDGGKS